MDTRLYGMHEEVLEDEDLPDELLYGRAGYLFAIQFLEYYLTDNTCVDTKIAEKVFYRNLTTLTEFVGRLSTDWVDYVEEPMKYQALRPHFFSVVGGGGGVGGGGVGVMGWRWWWFGWDLGCMVCW